MALTALAGETRLIGEPGHVLQSMLRLFPAFYGTNHQVGNMLRRIQMFQKTEDCDMMFCIDRNTSHDYPTPERAPLPDPYLTDGESDIEDAAPDPKWTSCTTSLRFHVTKLSLVMEIVSRWLNWPAGVRRRYNGLRAYVDNNTSSLITVDLRGPGRDRRIRDGIASLAAWYSTLRFCKGHSDRGDPNITEGPPWCGRKAIWGSDRCVQCTLSEGFRALRRQGTQKRCRACPAPSVLAKKRKR